MHAVRKDIIPLAISLAIFGVCSLFMIYFGNGDYSEAFLFLFLLLYGASAIIGPVLLVRMVSKLLRRHEK
jgi:hypothetical protein